MDDAISRQKAIDAHYEYCNKHPDAEFPVWSLKILEDLPSAEPDTDEWCTDCSEYDQERQYCPRWNRVIREALKDAQAEIVRCKDCKHRDPEDRKCDCGHDILWQLPRRDDWYCADAERRTDETD